MDSGTVTPQSALATMHPHDQNHSAMENKEGQDLSNRSDSFTKSMRMQESGKRVLASAAPG